MKLLKKYKYLILFVTYFAIFFYGPHIYLQQKDAIQPSIDWLFKHSLAIFAFINMMVFLLVLIVYLKAKNSVERYIRLFQDNLQTGFKSELHPKEVNLDNIDSADEQMTLLEEKSERLLNIASTTTQVFSVLTLVFYLALFRISTTPILTTIIFLVILSTSWAWLAKACDNLKLAKEPRLNDVRHTSDYVAFIFEQLDEAKKLAIYKASHRSYKMSQKFFPLLLITLSVGMNQLNFGILPVLIVGTIWIFQTVTYNIEVFKHSKKAT